MKKLPNYRYQLMLPHINGIMGFTEAGFKQLPRIQLKLHGGEVIQMVMVRPDMKSPVFVLIPEREIKDMQNERY